MHIKPPASLPGTVNLFINSACNFHCHHCYATFQDIRQFAPPKLTQVEAQEIIGHIAAQPLSANLLARKITFVGGEPTLCPFLPELVSFAKESGLVTAVITNGLTLTPKHLQRFAGILDWIGLSIDSVCPVNNRIIGRATRQGASLDEANYLERIRWIREVGARLKINTVVTTHNCNENLSDFIRTARPVRWKILQMTPVAGQNDRQIGSLKVSRAVFDAYIKRHAGLSESDTIVIPESIDTIRGSYAMISPDGKFFDSSSGRHKYSSPIKEVGLMTAFQQVTFDAVKYDGRDGNYDPFTGESNLPKKI